MATKEKTTTKPTNFAARNPKKLLASIQHYSGGEPFQILALGVGSPTTPAHANAHTEVGFFDDCEKAATAIERLFIPSEPGAKLGIYIIPDIDPALINRAKNRLVWARTGSGTKPSEILKRRWLMIDLDPDRPSGIASTDAEHLLAMNRGVEAQELLREEGLSGGMLISSGNGAHVMLALDDLENSKATNDLLRSVLGFIAEEIGGAGVEVDVKTFKATQGIRLFGCMSCKGDDSTERPWRQTGPWARPMEGDDLAVTAAQLRSLLPKVASKPEPRPANPQLAEYNVESEILPRLPGKTKPFKEETGGDGWKLSVCPLYPEKASHNNRSIIGQRGDRKIFFSCLGGSCAGKDWYDLKAAYSFDGGTFETPGRGGASAPMTCFPNGVVDLRADERPEFKLSASSAAGLESFDCFWQTRPDHTMMASRFLAGFDVSSATEGKVVFSNGELWAYRTHRGVWATVSEGRMSRTLMKWSRENYGTSEYKPVSINKGDLTGSYYMACAFREDKEFFTDPPQGFAAGTDFISADLEEKVVNINHLTPTHKARASVSEGYNPSAKGRLLRLYLESIHGDTSATSALPKEEQDEARAKVQLMGEILFSALSGLGPYYNKSFIICDHGEGGSGKSQFANILEALIPDDERTHIPISKWGEEYWAAKLSKSKLNLTPDGEKTEAVKGAQIAEGAFKSMVSGDGQSARLPCGQVFDFYPKFLHIMLMNGMIQVAGASGAFWDRVIILPFEQRFRGKDVEEKDIGKRIVASEMDAVLAWAMECGAGLVRRGRYTSTTSMDAQVTKAKRGGCSAMAWLEECAEVLSEGAPKSAWAKQKSAYAHYKEYAKEYGYGAMNVKTFIQRIKGAGVEAGKAYKVNSLSLTINQEDSSWP